MKRLLLSIVMAVSVLAANAFSYERAREQALFLTDKMAYELNLTEQQYDLAYQINLDYFLNVSSSRDIYGVYWQYRNDDLRYILYDWQYSLYSTLDYFFQPLRWVRSAWYLPVYSRYSRTHYFFGRPTVYISYRGGWRPSHHRSISPYASHRPHGGRGMRDHHYPGAVRPHGNHGSHSGGGYHPGDRNGHGYGRGNNGGRRDHGGVHNPGNNNGHNNGNPGNNNGNGYRGGHGNSNSGSQGSVGNQGNSHGRGNGNPGNNNGNGYRSGHGNSNSSSQGSVGSQGHSNHGQVSAPSNRSNSRSGSRTPSGRAGGRSYGR